MRYWQLLVGFLRAGLLCYGGGPASIPFVHREAVVRYGWMDDAAFSEMVAIANTLPGPINTKMAGYIGHKVGGMPGLLVATSAAILPTCLLMVALVATLGALSHHPIVAGMTRAVVPVVGVMLAVMGWQFLALGTKNLGPLVCITHAAAAALLIGFFGLHPAIALAMLLVSAYIGEKCAARIQKQGTNEDARQ